MIKTISQIELQISELREYAETLKKNYAQPYIQMFKKKYLWTDEAMEQAYKNAINQIAGLLIEKRDLEKNR